MSKRRPRVTRRQFIQHAGTTIAAVYLAGCSSGTTTISLSHKESETSSDDWDGLAEIALRRIRHSGAEYGDIRILETTREAINGRDGRIAGIQDVLDRGCGVRVLYRGAWGFAATSDLSPRGVARAAVAAVDVARESAQLVSEPVRLAAEPVHRDRVVTPREVDPFAVSLEQKTRTLADAMDAAMSSSGVRRCNGQLWAQRDVKLFASTEGSLIHFDLLATHGRLSATAVSGDVFESRTFETPYLRTGYEQIQAVDFRAEALRAAAEALEKAQAPVITPGTYDLVLDPRHLSLTIHESCGHPTELDRALGYEANYAGTSFMTPDQIGKLRYGSPKVSLVADNTEPGAMASNGYDDEGVAGQRWDVVREGIFRGYSTDRSVAPKIGLARSTGSCRADGWDSVPIVRIANIGLEPGDDTLANMISGVERGILISGRGSFSIDQRRYNFQFGGDAFHLIENGRVRHMLRDVIYMGITPEFWGACDAVADASHRERWGFITCGKGQPGQSGWMSHPASHARFRGIQVIQGSTTG